MPRKPRIHYPGAFYHVMLRGNAKQAIFFDNSDRCRLCLFLQEAVERFFCEIHAFCFMGNHVHLAIQVTKIPLSKIIQNVAYRYAQWINQKYSRVGHLFQGRFKAILVDSDSYLSSLVKYIHLNPVRAKLITDLKEAWWSSHETYLGNNEYPWVTTESVLNQFSKDNEKAIKLYQIFIYEKKEVVDHKKVFLKTNEYEKVMKEKVKTTNFFHKKALTQEQVINFVCLRYKLSKSDLLKKGRKLAEIRAVTAWLCSQCQVTTLKTIATYFHKDPSTLSEKIKFLSIRRAEFLSETLKELIIFSENPGEEEGYH